MSEDNDEEVCEGCKMLMEKVIESYSSVSNLKLAVRILNRVEGLEINEEGKVESGANPENLEEMVNILKKTIGPVAIRFIRDAVEEEKPSEKALESLPEKFKRV